MEGVCGGRHHGCWSHRSRVQGRGLLPISILTSVYYNTEGKGKLAFIPLFLIQVRDHGPATVIERRITLQNISEKL